MELDNRVILISRVSRGIGQANAKTLAKHSARAALIAISEDKLIVLQTSIEKDGGQALVAKGDVTKKKTLNA